MPEPASRQSSWKAGVIVGVCITHVASEHNACLVEELGVSVLNFCECSEGTLNPRLGVERLLIPNGLDGWCGKRNDAGCSDAWTNFATRDDVEILPTDGAGGHNTEGEFGAGFPLAGDGVEAEGSSREAPMLVGGCLHLRGIIAPGNDWSVGGFQHG